MEEQTIRGFKVGDVSEIKHTITIEDINKFVQLTGDDNPLHVDRRFAERTSFKGIVAHGMLGASFISTIIGKHIPGDGALWVSQKLDFLLPVRIGDNLTVKAKIIDIYVSQDLITLSIEITNQHRQKVLTGESRVKVIEVEDDIEQRPDNSIPKVAIVTGASRGIGAATAKRLSRDGFAVLINYNTDGEAAAAVVEEITKNKGQALAFKADITNLASIEAMVSMAKRKFGAVTALVNNATSKIIPKKFAELEDSEIDNYWNLQFKAPLNLIRAVLPYFEEANAGSVVNIASTYTDNVPASQLLAYTATKAALVSATRSLAVEYGPKGFRFNVVSPGMTDTSLLADVPEKARVLTKMQTPLRRLAKPDDVANGIAFLLSDEARHITGETLRICGGSVML
jgi:3-oxoacyl-[acyl-carrier protein] reductase